MQIISFIFSIPLSTSFFLCPSNFIRFQCSFSLQYLQSSSYWMSAKENRCFVANAIFVCLCVCLQMPHFSPNRKRTVVNTIFSMLFFFFSFLFFLNENSFEFIILILFSSCIRKYNERIITTTINTIRVWVCVQRTFYITWLLFWLYMKTGFSCVYRGVLHIGLTSVSALA